MQHTHILTLSYPVFPDTAVYVSGTLGVPACVSGGVIGGNSVSGSCASYVTRPRCCRSGIGSTARLWSVGSVMTSRLLSLTWLFQAFQDHDDVDIIRFG